MSYIANTQRTSEKGVINGYPSLDGSALVPTAQLGSETANNTKFLRGDQTWQSVAATPASTVTDETTFGIAKVVGTASAYAREDHTHGTPTNPTGGKSMPTGDIVGTSDTQTLTAKTLTTPTLTTPTVNGVKVAIATKTEAYTALATDYVLLGNCTTAAFSITLPAVATSTGQQYKIKKIDSDITHALTIDGNESETIDGATTRAITTQWDSVTIVCDGTAWFVV